MYTSFCHSYAARHCHLQLLCYFWFIRSYDWIFMYMDLKLDQVHHCEGWIHVNHAKIKFKVCSLLVENINWVRFTFYISLIIVSLKGYQLLTRICQWEQVVVALSVVTLLLLKFYSFDLWVFLFLYSKKLYEGIHEFFSSPPSISLIVHEIRSCLTK